MKIFALIFIVMFGVCSFAQESSNSKNFYYFKIESVDNYDDAKHTIYELRQILGDVPMYFDDETDKFKMVTHLHFLEEEIVNRLAIAGFEIVEPMTIIYHLATE
ncbi:MAG: hypothetical protein MI810_13315 [Flavobacteriales bacterium]|jgi:hypothetical protein|nr:hypothetical protein [Flavobacteriales bacterium]